MDKSAFTPSNATQGQIGIQSADQWPFIQLYDLTIETFDVVYEQAGTDEVVTLNFDSDDLDDYASLTLDRQGASQGSEIHLVITDNQLNIDPTAEDVVIFYTHSDRCRLMQTAKVSHLQIQHELTLMLDLKLQIT